MVGQVTDYQNLRYPLQWPAGRPRTAQPERARFGSTTFNKERRQLMGELMLLAGRSVHSNHAISTNLELRKDGLPYSSRRSPDDKGVAVYFQMDGQPYCFCCDRWQNMAHNLRAIVLHIGAMRGQNRWGVGTKAEAFAGYLALENDRPAHWSEILGVAPSATFDEVKAARNRRILRAHPDRGGTPDQAKAINGAFESFKLERQTNRQ